MSQKTTLAVLVVFALTGCATMLYEPPKQVTFILTKYDISLSEVERPAKAKERYGEQRIEKVQEGGIFKYYFEDEMVRILWIPSLYEISFVLNNKTDHSIKIVWDEASFVDEKGISHGVMHSGVKYTDRNNPQANFV